MAPSLFGVLFNPPLSLSLSNPFLHQLPPTQNTQRLVPIDVVRYRNLSNKNSKPLNPNFPLLVYQIFMGFIPKKGCCKFKKADMIEATIFLSYGAHTLTYIVFMLI